jgi:anti-sigma regulatory factor (Ser/Thr protein kinase)
MPGDHHPPTDGSAVHALRLADLSVVRPRGPLTAQICDRLAAALRPSTPDRPLGVVFDLTEIDDSENGEDGDVVALCLRLADEALLWPGMPAAILAGIPLARGLVAHGVGDRLPIMHTLESASAALRADTNWRRATLALPPSLEAPGQARRFLEDRVARWRLGVAAQAATLVVSELTTNAVTHARTFLDVQLTCHERYLAISVTDRSPRPVSVRVPALEEETGHGIVVVSSLADRWGQTAEGERGKSVWAVLYPTPSG